MYWYFKLAIMMHNSNSSYIENVNVWCKICIGFCVGCVVTLLPTSNRGYSGHWREFEMPNLHLTPVCANVSFGDNKESTVPLCALYFFQVMDESILGRKRRRKDFDAGPGMKWLKWSCFRFFDDIRKTTCLANWFRTVQLYTSASFAEDNASCKTSTLTWENETHWGAAMNTKAEYHFIQLLPPRLTNHTFEWARYVRQGWSTV